ncbi:NAD(P)-binding domain-containing protein, partial [Streptomyces carpinensis]
MTDAADAGDGANTSAPAAAKAATQGPVGPAGRVPSRGRGCWARRATRADISECARHSDIVIVAVPWDGDAEILQSLHADLAGKLVSREPPPP